MAEHTGGMLALVPTADHVKKLAVDGGDAPEELHLTLAYLGDDLTTLDDQAKQAIHDGAVELAKQLQPIQGDAFAHAHFNPNGTEHDPCAVYLINGIGEDARQHALALGTHALGDAMPEPYPNFVPHVTAGYGLDPTALSYTGPITFDRLRVAIAGDTTDYPLGQQEAPVTDNPGIPVRFPVLAVEGLSTSDGRYIEPGALDHRPLPIPILAQTQTPVGGGGHDGAHVIGNVTSMARIPGPTVVSKVTGKPFPEGTFVWTGAGHIDPAAPAANLAQKGYLTGNSVDLSEVEAFIETDPDNPAVDDDGQGMKIGGPTGERMRLTKGVIAATTLVPIPAFADAYVELDGQQVAQAEGLLAAAAPPWRSAELGDDTCLPCALGYDMPVAPQLPAEWFLLDPNRPLTAAATADLVTIDWFRNPELPGPTPLTVDDDRRVYGHLAQWNTCHTGFTGKCVLAPRSPSDYAYFRTGAVVVLGDDGEPTQVGAGKLTVVLDTLTDGHAGSTLAPMPAAAHYDNAGTAVADVEVGEDQFGIWVAGAVRPTATPEQVAALRAAPLSGDWRPINGRLELVAALGVNTPGFPMPRARVASGQVVSLVAAGVVQRASGPATDQTADKVAANVAKELGVKVTASKPDLDARKAAALARVWSLTDRHTAALDTWAMLDALTEADQLLAEYPDHEWFTAEVNAEFNWVTKAGGLPSYIKRIAKHLKEKGMATSRAIATAVNAAKKMCATGDVNFPGKQQVNAGSRAEACTAVADWNRGKAQS